nr:alpha/beta fold hydrolase [Pseudomonas aeruginosa]
MLILLPDFIGHPSCFRGLLARLGATDCRLVDYHRLDAYASIEALASQVLDGLAEEPDWLIGYSFGGLVGYEMARQLPASRLLMIDSHLPWPALRRMPPSEQYQRWLSAEMREWIALMSELGELRELFWDDWFARSGLDALVRDHLRKPRLLRHAAFIKRHADESYIPLHQDIALWEKRYESAQTFWVALTPSRNDNGGMFYYPDDRTIFPHEFDLAYPMFKCIDLQANGISREQLVDAELDAGDVLVWPARTAHGSHNNRSGQLRIGMPIVFVDDDEFHQLNREDSMKTWIASNLKSVFPDEAITEDNLDHYLPQLCDYSLKMVTFLARFSRQFGHAPKIHDFIREPRLATLSASDAGARR